MKNIFVIMIIIINCSVISMERSAIVEIIVNNLADKQNESSQQQKNSSSIKYTTKEPSSEDEPSLEETSKQLRKYCGETPDKTRKISLYSFLIKARL